ncbi:hypothetical protein JYU19_02250 [bacterium AH-315-J21]|nr:hypothetical protein [bacterium AH-315-J21]
MKKIEIAIRYTMPAATIWVLVLVGSLWPVDSLWGFNSAKYSLPSWAIISACILGFLLSIYPLIQGRGGIEWGEKVSKCESIWAKGSFVYFGVAILAGAMFYFLRLETYFLGDGYNWISNFSNPDFYVAKFTEPLSTRLVRFMQLVQGEYTGESAILSFQILSIVSGVAATFFSLKLIRVLVESAPSRILGLVVWFSSGGMLLFLGYPEFYAPLWAVGAAFLYFSISYLKESSSLWPSVGLFVFAMSIHLQAAYLAPAVLYLIYVSAKRREVFGSVRRLNSITKLLTVVLGIATLSGFVFFYETINSYFLPLFVGRPSSPDYTMFSLQHIGDIFNLVLMVFPGFVVLFALSLGSQNQKKESRIVGKFFQLVLLGSLTFLLTIDPVLGMARDWDLFSFTVVPLMFYLLHTIESKQISLPLTTMVSVALISVFMTTSYVVASVSRESSVERYHDLLNLYGAKHRGGWTILAEYYSERGDEAKTELIRQEMTKTFPDYEILSDIFEKFGANEWRAALKSASYLVSRDPNNVDFLQAQGTALARLRMTDRALVCYDKMIKLRPFAETYRVEKAQIFYFSKRYAEARAAIEGARKIAPSRDLVLEYVARILLSMNYTDSAFAIADSMLSQDEHSATGVLLKFFYYNENEESDSARAYFYKFREFGRSYYGYGSILNKYGNKYQ